MRHHKELQCEYKTHTKSEQEEEQQLLEGTLTHHLTQQLQRATIAHLSLCHALLRHSISILINEASNDIANNKEASTYIDNPLEPNCITKDGT